MNTVFLCSVWRSFFRFLTIGGLVVGPGIVQPVRAEETPQVVILTPMPYDILDQSIAGIKELLTTDGTKLRVTEISANGQMALLSSTAKEIIAGHPAVIVPVSTLATAAVVGVAARMPETNTQAVVYCTVTDPSRANVPVTAPNITGVSDVVDYRANVNLLHQLLPKARNVATIFNPGDPAAAFGMEKIRPLFKDIGINLHEVAATGTNEVVNAARLLTSQGEIDAIYIGSDGTAVAAMPGLVAIAHKAGIPVIASDAGSVREGALAAVSVDYHKLGLACGRLVADIVRSGKSAGEFPRINFLGDTLIINADSAKAIRYTFPPEVIAQSPQVVGKVSLP